MSNKLFDKLSTDQKRRASNMIPNDKQSGNSIYARQLNKTGELSFISVHRDLIGKELNPKNSPYTIRQVPSKDDALEMASAYIIQKEGAKGELEAAELKLSPKAKEKQSAVEDDKNKALLLEIQRQKEEIAAMRDVIASMGTASKRGRKPKPEVEEPATQQPEAQNTEEGDE